MHFHFELQGVRPITKIYQELIIFVIYAEFGFSVYNIFVKLYSVEVQNIIKCNIWILNPTFYGSSCISGGSKKLVHIYSRSNRDNNGPARSNQHQTRTQCGHNYRNVDHQINWEFILIFCVLCRDVRCAPCMCVLFNTNYYHHEHC